VIFKKEVNKFCTGILKLKIYGTINNAPYIILATKGLSPQLREQEFDLTTNEVGEIGEVDILRVVEEGDLTECDLQGFAVEHPPGKLTFDYKIKNEPFKSTKVMKIPLKKALDPMAMLKKSDSSDNSAQLLSDLSRDAAAAAPAVPPKPVSLEEME